MERHRETFSTCARLLVIGLLASCALDQTGQEIGQSADGNDGAAAADDKTLWNREARAWIACRLTSGSNSRKPRRRTHRRDTLPDTPRALALAPHRSPDPVPGKTGTR